MYKQDDSPQLMYVRRDNSAHLPSPRRRHSNDDRVPGNELPTTTNLDDMIDALDHDISRVAVERASSESRDTHGPLSFQRLQYHANRLASKNLSEMAYSVSSGT